MAKDLIVQSDKAQKKELKKLPANIFGGGIQAILEQYKQCTQLQGFFYALPLLIQQEQHF